MNIKEQIKKAKIIPVIKLENQKDTLPLIDALIAGGLPIAEITFRTAAAPACIALVKKHRPEVLLGAGTILTIDQAKAALEAGAAFIVSPGFNPELVDYCIEQNVLIIPGVNNPTQVELGMRKGLDVLKFFPAEASGGVDMIKALSSVYPVSFMPTGGINSSNILMYLKIPSVIACGGSWMVKEEYIKNGDFNLIKEKTKEAVTLVG